MRKKELYYDGDDLMGGCDETVVKDGYNSPTSDSCLRFARSHGELAGRRELPVEHGLSIREKLETEDYWNRD